MVPILTRKQLIKIHKAGNTSDRKFLNILKDIEKEAGARLFEDNLEQEIRDSINSWQHLYSVKEVGVDPLMPSRLRRCRERWEH